MMFVDLLHTWIASERGGTEQTRKLSADRGLGQGARSAEVWERAAERRELAQRGCAALIPTVRACHVSRVPRLGHKLPYPNMIS